MQFFNFGGANSGAAPSAPVEKSQNRTFKRLIVCSDGTWQTLETAIPTNIRYSSFPP
jgi:uncharacterized protein (DUF2235 family)